MAYLDDHKPRTPQFRARRATPTGLVVVHTAESFPDEVGPDTGAESVAAFIANRTTYGSYHDLVDSDSILDLVRYDMCAYGDGTGSNDFAYHVSFATSAAQWPQLSDEWVEGALRNGARAVANYARWVKRTHGRTFRLERVTRVQSDQGMSGLIAHGERDPGRRTDPGAGFPWSRFMAMIGAELSPKQPPKPSRGTVVDAVLPQLSGIIGRLDNATAEPDTNRRRRLNNADDRLREARRELRGIAIINAKNRGRP